MIILIFFVVILIYIILSNFETCTSNTEQYNDISTEIMKSDINYFSKFLTKNKIFINLVNNNKLHTPLTKKNKILFVTFENREKKYVTIHNDNLKQYTKKWNHSYKFYNECLHNVYWCKIQLVLSELENPDNDYDYIIWMDSDTIIKNININLSDILNKFSSDIFIASDNLATYDLINAGVFIVKNNDIGKQFLKDCISDVKKECFNEDGKLKGLWAASCYEQGQMNLKISDKYSTHTTVLPNNIILNYGTCFDDVFIMHLYGSSDIEREKCFMSIDKNE